jgi:uncharacterized protein (TIGR02145 family)
MRQLYILIFLIISVFAKGQTIMRIHQNNGTIIQIPISTIDSITFFTGAPGNLATITTIAAENITTSNALSGGNIINDGGTPVTQRGICWATTPNPTTANNVTVAGSGIGLFGANLNNLNPGTTYYARAYAINTAGTAYGNQVSFTTPLNNPLVIGEIDRVWMSQDSFKVFSTNNNCRTWQATTGIVWDRKPNPSLRLTTKTTDQTLSYFTSADNSFCSSQNVSAFRLDTVSTYYVRIYAANERDTIYGEELIVHAPGSGTIFNPNLAYDSVFDIDNNKYKTIKIGNQIWMAENLRVTRFNNGDALQYISDSYSGGELQDLWITTDSSSYTNWTLNGIISYNGHVVKDTRNICPKGWRIPSTNDWSILTGFLGGEFAASNALRSTLTQSDFDPYNFGWRENVNATNISGFSALTGYLISSYNGMIDYPIGWVGEWWATAGSYVIPWEFRSKAEVIGGISENEGRCIRCIKE